MPIPSFEELMLPILKLAQNEPLQTQKAIAQLSEMFHLTDENRQEVLKSGQTRMSNRVYWGFVHLAKAELLNRQGRGLYAITEAGRELLKNAPQSISRRYLFEHYAPYRRFCNNDHASSSSEGTLDSTCVAQEKDTPEELLDHACKEIEDSLFSELYARLLSLTDSQFEFLIIELMRGLGYGAKGLAKHTGCTGDGGIDGVITEDLLGLDIIYLQAKHYAPENPVDVSTIRSFIGAMDAHGVTRGVFVTTSRFTKNAEAEAQRTHKHIKLIDGQELTRIMIAHDIGVRNYKNITLKKLDLDFFDDLEG